jgi:hypothetical protein
VKEPRSSHASRAAPTGDEHKARHRSGRVAGRVGHLVFISVVGTDKISVVSGIDRAMFGYFASKLAAEQVIAWTRSAAEPAVLPARRHLFHQTTGWTLHQLRHSALTHKAENGPPRRVTAPAGMPRRR